MKHTIEQLKQMTDSELNELAYEIMKPPDKYLRIGAYPPYTTNPNDTFTLIAFAETKGLHARFYTHNNSACFYPLTKSGMVCVDDIEYVKADSIPKSITLAFIMAFEKE